MAGLLFLALIILIIAPEIYIAIFLFIGLAGYGVLEFILRLFGKSFDNEPTDADIKDAFINYAKSHERLNRDGLISITPMQYSYDSFAEECRRNPSFYRKYKK